MEGNSIGKLAAAHARANSEGIERNRATGNYIKVFLSSLSRRYSSIRLCEFRTQCVHEYECAGVQAGRQAGRQARVHIHRPQAFQHY